MKSLFTILAALMIPPAIYFPTRGAELRNERARLGLDVARSAERTNAWKRAWPDALATTELRARTESAAAITGVQLVAFEPDIPYNDGEFKVQQIEVEVIGPAASTAAFLTDLANAEPITHMFDLRMRREPSGWHSRFFMRTFALLR